MSKKLFLTLLVVLALVASCFGAMATTSETAAEAAEATEPAAAEPAAIDPEKTLIVTINGEDIMLSDVLPVFQQYAAQYQQYGMDVSSAEAQQSLLNYVINSMMQEKLLRQKATELGLDTFTEEEEAQWQKSAQDNYDYMLSLYLASQGDEEGKTDEEKQQAAAEMLERAGYSVEGAVENMRSQEILKRVYDYATEGVEIPDAAVKNAYDKGVKEAKDRYAEDLAAYGTEALQGSTIYYTPEGYRTVKHILVKCDDAKELKELKAKLEGLKEGDAEYEETVKRIDEIMATVQPKLDEIQARIDAGEDFQALIDEYGEDSGMKSGDTAEIGYYVCADTKTYVDEFQKGSMALAAVGDVSEPILTDYGFHIIRYNSDVPAGETPYEDISEDIHTQLLNEAAQAAYSAKVREWAEAATIVYPENTAGGAAEGDAAESQG